jgi:uncharacterized protein
MRTESRTAAAPANLGVAMIGVPAGADVELDIRLEAVMEGVLVSGTVRAPVTGECARCLDKFTSTVEVDFQELFVYSDTRSGAGAGDDEYLLEGDLLDLEPVLRDAVVLALPLSPACRDDCPGLCAECGVRLAEAGPDHRHEAADPRWDALRGLLETENDTGEGPAGETTDDATDHNKRSGPGH